VKPVINKFRDDMLAVVDLIPNGASVAIGGFGNTGMPHSLCNALCILDKRDLHIVSNNAGIDPTGVGRLAGERRIRKFTGSFPNNDVFTEQLMAGHAELELVPQGTLVERLRAAGAGIPGFYTATSAGTILADGTYPSRYNANGEPIEYMPAKEQREFATGTAVLELALPVDFALVHAHRADRLGNLAFRLSARNFNPAVAMAAAVTIVETEVREPSGGIAPDDVHLPGIYVDHVVLSDREAR